MTHNKKIRTFANNTCHIKLKVEHLEAVEPSVYAYVVELSSKGFLVSVVTGTSPKREWRLFKSLRTRTSSIAKRKVR